MGVAGGHRAREVVEEWLRFHGCHATLAALHRELGDFMEAQSTLGGEATASYEWRKKAGKKMMQLLEGGRRRLFWSAWETYVPASIRETDPDLPRLEIDLHVYFVVAALCPPKVREGLFPPIGANGAIGMTGRAADGMPEGVRGGDQVEATWTSWTSSTATWLLGLVRPSRGCRSANTPLGRPRASTGGERRVRTLLRLGGTCTAMGGGAGQGSVECKLGHVGAEQSARNLSHVVSWNKDKSQDMSSLKTCHTYQ
eukprot:CAMPEP_0179424098 /NCGR_PEP_ID=MMETSP0799-20121207/11386_1 /TAXON_ID=46947 /ORGANISM="Geminigera cryophila, Strain CCMP2564" /LENGTH=254 /DNA_ID=CAMNT_0021198485 /DNA_START=106 /DNA_END=870 /DNA_ORIENTATION=+